jgi:hypothetical protein
MKDEASLLYLLHAALQQAAAGSLSNAPAPHRSDTNSSSSSSSSSGGAGDGTSASDSSSSGSNGGSSGGSSSEGVVWRVAAADQPHASLQEVLAVGQPLHDKVKRRLATAYQVRCLV